MFIFRRIGSKINKIAMESTNKFANSINSINSINRTILTTPIELENKNAQNIRIQTDPTSPNNPFIFLILLGLPLFYYIKLYYGGKYTSINN